MTTTGHYNNRQSKNALFLTFVIAWQVINGVNENEGRGKSGELEPCFTVRVLSFERKTEEKGGHLYGERCEVTLSLFPSVCGLVFFYIHCAEESKLPARS